MERFIAIDSAEGHSGPKTVLPLLVARILAELDGLSVFHPPDVHRRKRGGNFVSTCIDHGQNHDKIAVRKHIVHGYAERTVGKFDYALKEASDLVMAGIIT